VLQGCCRVVARARIAQAVASVRHSDAEEANPPSPATMGTGAEAAGRTRHRRAPLVPEVLGGGERGSRARRQRNAQNSHAEHTSLFSAERMYPFCSPFRNVALRRVVRRVHQSWGPGLPVHVHVHATPRRLIHSHATQPQIIHASPCERQVIWSRAQPRVDDREARACTPHGVPHGWSTQTGSTVVPARSHCTVDARSKAKAFDCRPAKASTIETVDRKMYHRLYRAASSISIMCICHACVRHSGVRFHAA
jgi:hypothetical protein